MTKTILVTDLNEITNVKVSCKKCGYAVQLPCKIPNGYNMHDCPSCGKRFPLSDESVKDFFRFFRSLLNNLKDDPNFKNIKFEIETEDTK